jgi:hypothetical protein
MSPICTTARRACEPAAPFGCVRIIQSRESRPVLGGSIPEAGEGEATGPDSGIDPPRADDLMAGAHTRYVPGTAGAGSRARELTLTCPGPLVQVPGHAS